MLDGREDGDGWTIDDVRLHIAAQITQDIRSAVFRELGYTCTAGIAHNKMLAKLVSAKHKPNKQTALPAAAVLPMMRTVPLRKIKMLGGKLGSTVERDLGVTTVRALLSGGGSADRCGARLLAGRRAVGIQ